MIVMEIAKGALIESARSVLYGWDDGEEEDEVEARMTILRVAIKAYDDLVAIEVEMAATRGEIQ